MSAEIKKRPRSIIPTWIERCDVTDGRVPTHGMIQARMQAEIADLRFALNDSINQIQSIKQKTNCYDSIGFIV